MQQIQRLRQQPLAIVGLLAIIAGIALLGYSLLVVPPPQADGGGIGAQEVLDQPETLSVVYISGAVVAPDVYQVAEDARLKDLVVAAGGFTAVADSSVINLAERVEDGQHVHIPERVVADVVQAPQPGDVGDGKIALNSADAAELDALPGIGPTIAERIVAYRDANGPFQSVEDLREVEGIGASLFAKIAPLVSIGP